MTKAEMLNRKFESLERQQENILNMYELTEADIKRVQEDLTFELNKKLNNVKQRKERYEKMFDNVQKEMRDIEAELKQIESDSKQKETNRTSKFG
jgi:septation ring formation regulator EzrA